MWLLLVTFVCSLSAICVSWGQENDFFPCETVKDFCRREFTLAHAMPSVLASKYREKPFIRDSGWTDIKHMQWTDKTRVTDHK